MINQLLNQFLTSTVNPSPETVSQAEESQKRLREILVNKLAAGDTLPSLLDGQDFLFGSAIRGTQSAPFDDIDLMLVLDGSTLVAHEGGQIVGTAYGSGENYNVLTSAQYTDANGMVSSQKILDRIRSVIAETYTRSIIRKDGQAINVWMDSYGFGIDVVPAFKISFHGRGDHYYIPLGTGSDMWRSTNPHADLTAFASEDSRLGGLLRPTARLMRKWNELSNAGRMSGFHVDALVYHSLLGKTVQTIDQSVLTSILAFEELLGSYCPQFSGFQPHIDHKLDPENRQKSAATIQDAKNSILTAMSSQRQNEIQAAWNKIFDGKLF